MSQPNDTHTLPDPLLERILVCGIRATAPSMRQPGIGTDDATKLLVQFLNALPRSCAPQVLDALIMQCPWIDANFASLTSNIWLLDLLAHKLAKAPYWRPMQYDDSRLLDHVSAKGFVDVLEWWDKSDYVIRQAKPMAAAAANGHVEVLQWWLDSERLGNFIDTSTDNFKCSLIEPTRNGQKQVLDWWLENVLEGEIETNEYKEERWLMSNHLEHNFLEGIWAAVQAEQVDLVDWWVDLSVRYTGYDSCMMALVFASGNQDLVKRYSAGYTKETGGHFLVFFALAVFSGKIEFIKEYHQLCNLLSVNELADDERASLCFYASCAGHVHVLKYLKSQNCARRSALFFHVPDFEVYEPFWTMVPRTIVQDARTLGIDRMSMLEALAQQGQLDVLKWWNQAFKADFTLLLKDRFTKVLNMALINNRIAVLDWLLSLNLSPDLSAVSRGVQEAASRGHLEAIRWYLAKARKLPKEVTRKQAEAIIRAALAGGHLDLCDWLLSTVGKGLIERTDFKVAIDVLRETVCAPAVYWCFKNAAKLPLDSVEALPFRLCATDAQCYVYDDDFIDGVDDEDEYEYKDPTLSQAWSLLCMIGAEATTMDGRKVKFVPLVTDVDPEGDLGQNPTFMLVRMFKHFPLFLEQLPEKCGDSSIRFELDLDTACSAKGGVAVLDWMYSRCKSLGLCTWSSRGHQSLTSNNIKAPLYWWEKMSLPQDARMWMANVGGGGQDDVESELDDDSADDSDGEGTDTGDDSDDE